MPIRIVLAVLLVLVSACVGPSPSRLTSTDEHLVVVSSVRLPNSMPWYTLFAEHTWIDVKDGDEESWLRLEVSGRSSGVRVSKLNSKEARKRMRWSNRVSVLETLTGELAKRAIPRLMALAESEPDYGRREMLPTGENSWRIVKHAAKGREYAAWPGPNSNTFIATLIDRTPDLHAEFHHNAVGRDYPRGVRAGVTASGLGLEVDSAYFGLGLGLRQGVEVRLAQLTFGVSLWPPAVKLPFLPRLGIHQGWIGGL